MNDWWNDPPELDYDDAACFNCGADLPEYPEEGTPAWNGYCSIACQQKIEGEKMNRETTGCAELDAIKAAFQQGDAASWGPANFYDDAEEALRGALAAGIDFDTGWYSVKKEIQSARIIRAGDLVSCEVSCSDDFDTEGLGHDEFRVSDFYEPSVDDLREAVTEALDNAADRAEQDRHDNQMYAGFSIGPATPEGTLLSWRYTYIAPAGEGYLFEGPPGDNYHRWGWQEDPDEMLDLPDDVRAAFEMFVQDPDGPRLVLAGWVIQAWEGGE